MNLNSFLIGKSKLSSIGFSFWHEKKKKKKKKLGLKMCGLVFCYEFFGCQFYCAKILFICLSFLGIEGSLIFICKQGKLFVLITNLLISTSKYNFVSFKIREKKFTSKHTCGRFKIVLFRTIH